jgi:hypothetical protein
MSEEPLMELEKRKFELSVAVSYLSTKMLSEIVTDLHAEYLLVDGVKAGDTKLVWDPDNESEVECAKATFDKLIAKGFTAFHVKDKGEQGEKMKKFDPEAGKIILVPRIQGGV